MAVPLNCTRSGSNVRDCDHEYEHTRDHACDLTYAHERDRERKSLA